MKQACKKTGLLMVLASKSPRREEILSHVCPYVKVHPSSYEEKGDWGTPAKTAKMHAIMKARDVAIHYKDEGAIVIGVDTIGAYKGRILGKPNDDEEAREMLEFLNGSTHEVISGLAVINTAKNQEFSTTVTTKVTFEQMSQDEIDAYVKSGEGADKAAGYAIQGIGALFVKKIEGDYFNVVGLPVNALFKLLKRAGYDILEQF